MKARLRNQNPGVALFLVITSLVIISLAMRELIVNSSAQVDRIRNSYDRLQALYLARSNLSLARFWILFDAQARDGGVPADTLEDFPPLPFPVTSEMLAMVSASMQGEENADREAAAPQSSEKQKICAEFNEDFPGTSQAVIQDLSARLNLNALTLKEGAKEYETTLTNLLSPNFEFLDELARRGINRDEVIQQIRDYIDTNSEEDSTNASELFPYAEADLPYGPKNRPIRAIEELKLIPAMDDQLFFYLRPLVNVVPFQKGQKDAKINLNTVGREVFRALLRNVNNPDDLAKRFLEDRVQNARIYTERDLSTQLEEAGLSFEVLPKNMVGTKSEAFLVTTRAEVGETEVVLEAIVKKPLAGDVKPVLMMRIEP